MRITITSPSVKFSLKARAPTALCSPSGSHSVSSREGSALFSCEMELGSGRWIRFLDSARPFACASGLFLRHCLNRLRTGNLPSGGRDALREVSGVARVSRVPCWIVSDRG